VTILQEIIAAKRIEVEQRRALVPEKELEQVVPSAPPVRDFFAALTRSDSTSLIAEVKKASPSAGVIREDFDPVQIARAYQRGGASCISVLTDEDFFQGKLQFLTIVRAAVALPILRKDFIVDRYQLVEARVAGADAVLLIAECLDDCRLQSLHQATLELGMVPLVELHQPNQVTRVLKSGAKLIGINNRDLSTFETDIEHTLQLRSQIPGDCVVVSESGICSHQDVVRLGAANIDAVLVGEHLMRQPDIEVATAELLGNPV
jgi:indole-3-glycerol phosphate synthase